MESGALGQFQIVASVALAWPWEAQALCAPHGDLAFHQTWRAAARREGDMYQITRNGHGK